MHNLAPLFVWISSNLFGVLHLFLLEISLVEAITMLDYNLYL